MGKAYRPACARKRATWWLNATNVHPSHTELHRGPALQRESSFSLWSRAEMSQALAKNKLQTRLCQLQQQLKLDNCPRPTVRRLQHGSAGPNLPRKAQDEVWRRNLTRTISRPDRNVSGQGRRLRKHAETEGKQRFHLLVTSAVKEWQI